MGHFTSRAAAQLTEGMRAHAHTQQPGLISLISLLECLKSLAFLDESIFTEVRHIWNKKRVSLHRLDGRGGNCSLSFYVCPHSQWIIPQNTAIYIFRFSFQIQKLLNKLPKHKNQIFGLRCPQIQTLLQNIGDDFVDEPLTQIFTPRLLSSDIRNQTLY